MALVANGKNLMLDALAGRAAYVSLHSADPGTRGTSELSGGSPAYSREAITWGSASSGSLTSSDRPVFDVPASSSVVYVGLWSADTGGTFYGSGVASAREDFGGQGTYTLDSATVRVTDPA